MPVVPLEDLDDEVILTVVDGGPVRCGLVANWLASLERVGLRERAVVVAMDQDAVKCLLPLEVPILAPWPDAPGTSGALAEFGSPPWSELVWKKLEGIHDVLASGRRVLYSDPDVVFLRDPLPHVQALGVELCVQSDAPATEPLERSSAALRLAAALGRVLPLATLERWFGLPETDRGQGRLPEHVGAFFARHLWPGWARSRHTICAGFMYLRPTPRVLGAMDARGRHGSFEHDQEFLHHEVVLRRKARHVVLAPNLFPNGNVAAFQMWQGGRAALDEAYIVHVNWCVGTQKIERLKELGLWYV